jgi:hypothetical protein
VISENMAKLLAVSACTLLIVIVILANVIFWTSSATSDQIFTIKYGYPKGEVWQWQVVNPRTDELEGICYAVAPDDVKYAFAVSCLNF